MHFPKAGSIVFLGLVLMTAGFVLTLAGWFAPPIREAVLRVRLAGPVSLLVGFFLLGVSCCLCAFQQRKCCSCCYPAGACKEGEEEEGHTQMSPLLLREMRQAMDRCGADTSGGATCTSSATSLVPPYNHHPQQQVLPPDQFVPPRHYYNRHTGDGARHAGRKKRRPKGPDPTPDACDGPLPSPRPAAIFIPRAGLYHETFVGRADSSAADHRPPKVKVTVQPLPVAPARPSGSHSAQPPADDRAVGPAPTVYFRSYADEIVSAL